MSADNVIYIQEQPGGKWAVWEDSASNDNPRPRKMGIRYPDKTAALLAAEKIFDECVYVEYGIQTLTPRK